MKKIMLALALLWPVLTSAQFTVNPTSGEIFGVTKAGAKVSAWRVRSVGNLTGTITASQLRTALSIDQTNNTLDINKPLSLAVQDALALKAPLLSPALTGVPTAPTAAGGTNTTQIATTAFVQTGLAGKANVSHTTLVADISATGTRDNTTYLRGDGTWATPSGGGGGSGADGTNGWSPVFSVVSDSDRRVLQVSDWAGGTGSKPTTGQYVGASGLTGTIGSAVDIRGPQGTTGATGATGPQGNTGPTGAAGSTGATGATGSAGTNGTNGWAPVLAVVSDGERRVLQVSDWTGGTGSKPTTGQYVGASGLTGTIGSAIDVRGPAGSGGGSSVVLDADVAINGYGAETFPLIIAAATNGTNDIGTGRAFCFQFIAKTTGSYTAADIQIANAAGTVTSGDATTNGIAVYSISGTSGTRIASWDGTSAWATASTTGTTTSLSTSSFSMTAGDKYMGCYVATWTGNAPRFRTSAAVPVIVNSPGVGRWISKASTALGSTLDFSTFSIVTTTAPAWIGWR